jgi:glycine oxidase
MRQDALVIGGGVIGLAAARELARAGARVTLLTRDAPGAGTSRTAAGMLERHLPSDMPDALRALCELSNGLHPELAAALREETGADVGLDPTGTLGLATDAAEFAELRALARAVPGARLLEREADWLALEPRLPRGLAGALALDDDHAVNAPRLCAALLLAVERLGVRVVRGATVRRIVMEGGRVVGADADAGGFRAGWTVLAAGAWAGRMEGLPAPLPVTPVKGQLIVLETTELPARVLHDRHVYIVPRRADGQVVVGATVEDAGFDLTPTAGAVRELLADGLRLFPPLAAARLLEVRTGLRPGTPDGLPILGAAPWDGLILAAGHFRKGILLAPATARIVAAVAAGAPPPLPLAPYGLARFADARHRQR